MRYYAMVNHGTIFIICFAAIIFREFYRGLTISTQPINIRYLIRHKRDRVPFDEARCLSFGFRAAAGDEEQAIVSDESLEAGRELRACIGRLCTANML